jgi:6-phosphofructokinase 1
VGKAAQGIFGMQVIGFRDGFRGLMENRTAPLGVDNLSGILTVGGTILGTSRDKPRRMLVGGKEIDVSESIVANYQKHHLDALVCIGGGGTQKNALYLKEKGLHAAQNDRQRRGHDGREFRLSHRAGDCHRGD